MTQPSDQAVFLPSEEKNIGVILFHAYTGSTRDVNFLAQKLNREGYAVLAPLFSGHDTDDIKNVLNSSPVDWRQEAYTAYQWMEKQQFDHLLVFGLSMGGIMAADLITREDTHISGGGSINSPIITKEKTDISKAFMNLGKKLAKKRKELDEFKAESNSLLDRHWQQMSELEKIKQDIEERLEAVEIPFYIAQSGKDELIDPEDAYLLQNKLTNARIDFHFFPENTHTLPTNRDRKAFEQSIVDFIKQVTHPY